MCGNDCGYCGIRKHQKGVRRYTMPIDEVVEVRACKQLGWCVYVCVFWGGGGWGGGTAS